jgi:predicted MFS family arabinose efflux permease
MRARGGVRCPDRLGSCRPARSARASRQALAVVLAGTTLAFILGIPAGSAVGGTFGWRATFSYAGLLAIGAALLIALVLPAVRPSATRRPPLSAALTRPALRFLSLTLAAFSATFTVVAYVGPVVGLATGADGAGVGLFQMLVGFGSLAGVLIGSRIADRRGRLSIAAGLFAVMTLTLTAYSLATVRGPDGFANAWLLGLAMFGNALALFALSPVVQAGLVEAAPDAGPVVLALNASAIFFGQGIGAAIGGGAIALGGYGALGLVAAALAAGTALLVLTTFPRRPAITPPDTGGPP